MAGYNFMREGIKFSVAVSWTPQMNRWYATFKSPVGPEEVTSVYLLTDDSVDVSEYYDNEDNEAYLKSSVRELLTLNFLQIYKSKKAQIEQQIQMNTEVNQDAHLA